jgi:hypothetical protein
VDVYPCRCRKFLGENSVNVFVGFSRMNRQLCETRRISFRVTSSLTKSNRGGGGSGATYRFVQSSFQERSELFPQYLLLLLSRTIIVVKVETDLAPSDTFWS